MNHFASGGFHSCTFVHGENHASRAASSAQNASGSAIDRACNRLYSSSDEMCHFGNPSNAAATGGNVRCSWSVESNDCDPGEDDGVLMGTA